MELNIRRLNFRLGLIILILSGYAYAVYGRTMERIVFVISVIVLAIGICRYSLILRIRKNILDILHMVFVILLLVCGVVFSSATPVIYGIAMGLFYFISTDLMRANANEKTYTRHIYISNVAISLVIMAFSLMKSPITFSAYSGMFGNPNTMGIFAVTLSTVMIAGIVQKGCLGQKQSVFEILIWLATAFIVVISSCRTAMVVLAVQLVAAFLLFIIKSSLSKKTLLIIVLIPVVIALLYLILKKVGFIDILYNSMIEKFDYYEYKGDSTNGRKKMWIEIMQNSSWFHDGTLSVDLVGHSVYFGLMNQFGKIPAIVYALFMLTYCIETGYRTLKQKRDNYCFLPIMAAINFLVISITENYLMTSSMLLMYMTMEMDTVIQKKQTVDVQDDIDTEKMHDNSDVEKINEKVKGLAYFKF